MSEKKQLKDEELEKVSGGSDLSIDDPEFKQYEAMCPRQVDKYDTPNYVGKNVLLTYFFHPAPLSYTAFASQNWVYGTLLKSYEKGDGCGTLRTAEVKVIAACDAVSHSKAGDTREYCLDYWNCWVA